MPDIRQNVPIGFAACSLTGGIGTVDEEEWALTFGIEVETPPWTQANNDSLKAILTTDLQPLMSTQYSIISLRTSVATDGDPLIFTSELRVAGLRPGGNEEPPLVAALVRKNTGVGGRRNRGRWYLAGVLNDSEVDFMGGIATIRRTALQTAMDDLLVDVQAQSNIADVVILHSWDILDPPVPAPTPTPVTALVLQTFIASQRRRMKGFR